MIEEAAHMDAIAHHFLHASSHQANAYGECVTSPAAMR